MTTALTKSQFFVCFLAAFLSSFLCLRSQPILARSQNGFSGSWRFARFILLGVTSLLAEAPHAAFAAGLQSSAPYSTDAVEAAELAQALPGSIVSMKKVLF